MSFERILPLVNDISLLPDFPLEELEVLNKAYPYVQTLKLLLAKKLQLEEDERLNRQLAQTAVFSVDRKAFHALMQLNIAAPQTEAADEIPEQDTSEVEAALDTSQNTASHTETEAAVEDTAEMAEELPVASPAVDGADDDDQKWQEAVAEEEVPKEEKSGEHREKGEEETSSALIQQPEEDKEGPKDAEQSAASIADEVLARLKERQQQREQETEESQGAEQQEDQISTGEPEPPVEMESTEPSAFTDDELKTETKEESTATAEEFEHGEETEPIEETETETVEEGSATEATVNETENESEIASEQEEGQKPATTEGEHHSFMEWLHRYKMGTSATAAPAPEAEEQEEKSAVETAAEETELEKPASEESEASENPEDEDELKSIIDPVIATEAYYQLEAEKEAMEEMADDQPEHDPSVDWQSSLTQQKFVDQPSSASPENEPEEETETESTDPTEPVIDDESNQLSRRSNERDWDMVTETLAEILANQGKIDRALEIYDRLRLKYPEKSAYFARKIDQLKS